MNFPISSIIAIGIFFYSKSLCYRILQNRKGYDVQIKLAPDLAKIVRQKLDSGLYETPDAVIRTALQVLVEYDREDEEKLRTLRDMIQKGEDEIARGEYHVFTSMEELLKDDN